MSTEFYKETLINSIVEYISVKVPDFSKAEHLDSSFSRLGLDSLDHVHLSAIIENHIQQPIEPTLAFDYPTINALVDYLEKKFAIADEAERTN